MVRRFESRDVIQQKDAENTMGSACVQLGSFKENRTEKKKLENFWDIKRTCRI